MIELNWTQIIIAIIGLFATASSLTALVTIPYIRKKAKAEAAGKEQDVYQEIIRDLREDKSILKQEKSDLTKELEGYRTEKYRMTDEIEELKRNVKQLMADVKDFKEKSCATEPCKRRKPVE